MVPAKGSVDIPLKFKCVATKDATQPPTIECVIKMKDTKELMVPIFVWLRPDIDRAAKYSSDGKNTPPPLGISSWKPSPYDTLESDPTVRFMRPKANNNQPIVVRIEVPDQTESGYANDTRDVANRRKNPSADAVEIRWSDDQGDAWFFIEPFSPWSACSRSDLKPVTRMGKLNGAAGWWLEVELPQSTRTVNVGVADNDETYHTQWRWMIPESRLAPLKPE